MGSPSLSQNNKGVARFANKSTGKAGLGGGGGGGAGRLSLKLTVTN